MLYKNKIDEKFDNSKNYKKILKFGDSEVINNVKRYNQEIIDRLEKERPEKERLENERQEKERLEQERLEKERLEKEKLAEIERKRQPYQENGLTYINFGSYPQTIVSDIELINNLNNVTKTNNRNYYEYNGEEYMKISATPFEFEEEQPGQVFSNNEEVIEGEIYWFKIEPIKWRVLENNNGDYKLLSSVALDLQDFDEESNNYKNSEIRKWLNNDFYNKAFNNQEKEFIKITLVDNRLISTRDKKNEYICENTKDNVYLLSVHDVTNGNYGFDNNTDNCVARQIKVTDFAIAKGVLYEEDKDNYRNCQWWLRSPSNDDSGHVRVVDYFGNVDYDFIGFEIISGVCPAITLSTK